MIYFIFFFTLSYKDGLYIHITLTLYLSPDGPHPEAPAGTWLVAATLHSTRLCSQELLLLSDSYH